MVAGFVTGRDPGARSTSLTGLRIAVTVSLPFALGYFLSYLFRNVNAVLFPYFESEIGITAGGLGLLTAAYFLAFAGFQLPLGMLLDRYGPRRVEACLLLVAATGAIVFSFSGSLGGLFFGRLLIGLGVSGCLMAAFKANVMWWPAERLPLVNGLFMLSGGLGGMMGTAPVAAIVPLLGWREMFRVLAVLTLATAAFLILVVPERKTAVSAHSLRESVSGVWNIWTSRGFWQIAPATVLVHSAFITYQGFWVGPWLRDVGGLPDASIGSWVFATAASLTAGYAFSALAVDRLRRRSIDPLRITIVFMFAVMATEAALVSLPAGFAPYLWCLFAFFGTGTITSYAVLTHMYPTSLSGRVTTALNLAVFSAAFMMQSGVGVVVDLFAPAAGQVYAPEGYRAALAILLALQIPGVGWLLWSRRDRPEPAIR